MTARPQDVALLPLPMFDHHLPAGDGGPDTPMWSANKMRVYALEVATAALASAQAREEELRALLGGVECQRDANWQAYTEAEARAERLEEALRGMVGAAYPVRTSIDPRGHRWCEPYLDEALPAARAALSANAATQTGERT